MADLRPYPAYKPSSVPWLGDIPAHWEVRRLRTVVDMRVSNVDKHTRDNEDPVRLCNYVDVYKHDLITDRLPFMRATALPDEIRRFRLEPGDVLITKDSELWNDIGVPALVEYTAPDLICGYHLAMLRPNAGTLAGKYLFRALQSPPLAYQFHIEANGVTRYGLSHGAIKSVLMPLPPLPEQHAIARYLDHIDRRIRRYIRAKQKLMALLNEQKQAIIHQAVTRGLDPTVRLKPSGVEWLGDVPEHWEVKPLKRAFRSMDYGISESATNDGHIRLLTMGHIRDGVITVPNDGGVASVDPELLLKPSDLLFNRTNSAELVGKVGLFQGASGPVTFASYLVRMRPGKDHNPEYLNLLLNSHSALSAARREAIPSLHQSNLNPTRYGRLHVALPGLFEQHQIVEYLDQSLMDLKHTLAHARDEISLLREYRTRLIADVVTGKVDVRAAAAALPEEGAEIEDETAAAEDMEEADPDADAAEEEA